MNITSPVSVVDELERYEPEQYVGLYSPSQGRWVTYGGESVFLYLADRDRGQELLALAKERLYAPTCARDYEPHSITLPDALAYCRETKTTLCGTPIVGVHFPLTGEVIPL